MVYFEYARVSRKDKNDGIHTFQHSLEIVRRRTKKNNKIKYNHVMRCLQESSVKSQLRSENTVPKLKKKTTSGFSFYTLWKKDKQP